MQKLQNYLRRSSMLATALVLFAGWLVADITLFISHANAAQITTRSLQLSSSANGSLAAGQNVTYTFTFTIPGAASTVQSLDFQFCGTPLPGTDCEIRAGQSVTGAAIGSQTGLTGWALGTSGNAPTNTWNNGSGVNGGRVRLTRTNASNVSSDTAATISFTGITNPTTDNQAFYVRIVAYTDTAWTTSRDTGTVANSTAQQIDITARVQETLNFSVGATPVDPTTTCAAFSDSGAVGLGLAPDYVLDFTQAYDAHSYFRVSTNATNGTLIYYSGDTLKSGSNTIDSIGTAGAGTSSVPGTNQFGLAIDPSDNATGRHSFTNLAANNGSNVAGHAFTYASGDGTITNGGTAKFQFDTTSVTTPRPIAVSSGTITCDTGSVRYLGNISTTTPPGVYTTTITYIAAPTF